ncbi:PhzF family phenazine biosynthesis protein [Candidatus Falkowbacteria bacterium]|nr:PhzF family phenazine biosynthesis protein [Candidatus Falkowbacteria bacterium]
MLVTAFILNAFAASPTGGNPAGVVLRADDLTDRQMQRIATRLGFSETAFVQSSRRANWRVRFFTPKNEVNLCGHATIATFYLLNKSSTFLSGVLHPDRKVLDKKKLAKPGTYRQETKAGILKVTIDKDGAVYMDQPMPKFSRKIHHAAIAKALNIQAHDLDTALPVQLVSTGGLDMYVPVRRLTTLLALRPNRKQLIAMSRQYGIEGFCVFTMETKKSATAHYRSFAPAVGINEDPACGVEAGALGCYLLKYGKVSKKESQKMVFETGYAIRRPSEIRVQLATRNATITRVRVGGMAANIKKIKIRA